MRARFASSFSDEVIEDKFSHRSAVRSSAWLGLSFMSSHTKSRSIKIKKSTCWNRVFERDSDLLSMVICGGATFPRDNIQPELALCVSDRIKPAHFDVGWSHEL